MELIVLNNGEETRVEVEERGSTYRVRLGEREFVVDSVAINGAVRSLVIEGRQFEVAVRCAGAGQYQISHQGSIDEVEVLDPLTYLAEQGSARRRGSGAQRVTAYMPGRVVEVLVEEGDKVVAGQGLVVLEAMKMENEIQAEHAAVVARVLVSAGQAVEGGDPLFELE
jgi:pyruvate carboxylase subunit B